MDLPIYIFDPTAADSQSKVRGIGRYVDMLKEYLGDQVVFTTSLDKVPFESVFISPFVTFTQTPLLKKRIAKKQLAIIHDLIPQRHMSHFPVGLKGTILAFYNRIKLNLYDGIITNSQKTRNEVLDLLGINPNIVHNLYPVISSDLFKEIVDVKPPVSEEKPFFIYVGDATWNKNVINIAKAVKTAQVKCLFIGKIFDKTSIEATLNNSNKWLKEIQGFYKELDQHYIQLKGFLTNSQLAAYYQQAQGNLLVSRDEGFGFSYIEAAYAGCPSVVGDRPIFHETAGDSALFADPENPDDIAAKIYDLQKPEIQGELKDKMKAQLQKYNPDEFAKAFFEIIDLYRRQ